MRISVVTPTRALDAFVAQSRASVARQSPNVAIEHLVVVDDPEASLPPEETVDHVRTRFLHNRRGKGPGGARNTGLDEATGDFVFFLDADDIWSDDHVRRVISIYYRDPKVDCVSVPGLSFGEDVEQPRETIPRLPQGRIGRRTVAWNPVGCPTGFSYRRDTRTAGLRFHDAIYFQDVIFYLELLRLGARFWRENSIHYWYRRSAGQLTSIVPTEAILASEGMVHDALASWRGTGLTPGEVAVATVQIRRLSAHRQRRPAHVDTLRLAAMAPSWAMGQVGRVVRNARLRQKRRRGAFPMPGERDAQA